MYSCTEDKRGEETKDTVYEAIILSDIDETMTVEQPSNVQCIIWTIVFVFMLYCCYNFGALLYNCSNHGSFRTMR